jgi:excinuclease ABC subunit B
VLYADNLTGSMRRAIDEPRRRRRLQMEYNERHGITPESVRRALDELLGTPIAADYSTVPLEAPESEPLTIDPEALEQELTRLEREMLQAAEKLEFERAAECRDRIRYLREQALLA